MRRKTAIILGSILATIALLVAWAVGNLSVMSDVVNGQEYLSREAVWSALEEPQREDPGHVTSMADVAAHPEMRLNSRWCGYKLLVKQGVRLADVPKDEIIAALIPTRAFPRWYVLTVFPPAIVLHANGASEPVSIADVPLDLSRHAEASR